MAKEKRVKLKKGEILRISATIGDKEGFCNISFTSKCSEDAIKAIINDVCDKYGMMAIPKPPLMSSMKDAGMTMVVSFCGMPNTSEESANDSEGVATENSSAE